MGKLYQGINGPFSGKVGRVVGYVWKRTPCMRAYQPMIRYPNTELQQQERDWFVTMVRFAGHARQALLLGLRHKAAVAGITEGNYFVTRNKQHFQRTDNGLVVDYPRLSIAEGPAADVVFHNPVFREHESISVDFDKNTLFSRASGDDKVYIYVYAPELGRGYLSAPTERRLRNVSIRLPEDWSGATVHIYGFVIDRELRSSNSTYIGAGRIDHYSEGGNYIPLNKSWMDFIEMANRANANSSSSSANAEPDSPEATSATPKHEVDRHASPPPE